MFCLVCVLVISVNPYEALAADFFMATNGNDAKNPGTIKQPFRTLARAVKALASGDRLLIRAGTYKRGNVVQLDVPSGKSLLDANGNETWLKATKIAAYGNEKVILTPYDRTTKYGSRVLEFFNGLSYISIEKLIIDGVLHPNGQGGGKDGIRLSYRGHHFRVIDTEILHMGNMGIATGDANYNEFIDLKIHDNNHNLTTSRSVNNYGIYMASDHNLVKGCDIYKNRGYGIHVYSSKADYQPDHNRFIGNKIHHNEYSGVIVGSNAGNVFINNLIYGNGTGATTGFKY